MERHARLLGILANLWGGLAMLVGISMLLLAAGALALSLDPAGDGIGFAAGFTAATFASIGVFTLLWGVAHVMAASMLARRRPAGRVLMLGLAVLNLLVLPFGTALGVYAIWVLLANDGRRLFEHTADAS